MEPVKLPRGHVLDDERTVEAVLGVEAELLRSEGIDPDWPGFPEEQVRDDEASAQDG